MKKIAVFLSLPYIVGFALFFTPSALIEAIYGEKNFAYMNFPYFWLLLGALACTALPFYFMRGRAEIRPVAVQADLNASESGPTKAYTIFFAVIVLLVCSSVTDLATYRDAVSKFVFLVDAFELLIIVRLVKQPQLRRAELAGVAYIALLNVLTLRRYALIPFLLLVLYLVHGRLKVKKIVKNAALVILGFLLIQFVRESGADGLPVLTLSSAYLVLPWNRLAMLIDGVTSQPYAGEYFYSFTSVFLPPGLPAGTFVWSDALGAPSKELMVKGGEFKTLQLLKEGFLPINWFTMLGDLYSDMGNWLLIYIGAVASCAALAMRCAARSQAAKVLSAYLFTAMMLVGTYNILMFPRFVWMLIAAAFLVSVPRIRLF